MTASEAGDLIAKAALEATTREQRREASARLSAATGQYVSPIVLFVARRELLAGRA